MRAHCGDGYQALFARAQDIPELVADGAAHARITGWDLVCESTRELVDRLDLEYGACRLVLAVPEESTIRELSLLPPHSRVATTFPRLTVQFFRARGLDIDVVPISGAVESAPNLGIADAIVDLTSTGSSLRANGLREVTTLQQSSARLVMRDTGSAGRVARLLGTRHPHSRTGPPDPARLCVRRSRFAQRVEPRAVPIGA